MLLTFPCPSILALARSPWLSGCDPKSVTSSAQPPSFAAAQLNSTAPHGFTSPGFLLRPTFGPVILHSPVHSPRLQTNVFFICLCSTWASVSSCALRQSRSGLTLPDVQLVARTLYIKSFFSPHPLSFGQGHPIEFVSIKRAYDAWELHSSLSP